MLTFTFTIITFKFYKLIKEIPNMLLQQTVLNIHL